MELVYQPHSGVLVFVFPWLMTTLLLMTSLRRWRNCLVVGSFRRSVCWCSFLLGSIKTNHVDHLTWSVTICQVLPYVRQITIIDTLEWHFKTSHKTSLRIIFVKATHHPSYLLELSRSGIFFLFAFVLLTTLNKTERIDKWQFRLSNSSFPIFTEIKPEPLDDSAEKTLPS